MITQFYHAHPRKEAYERVNSIFAGATKKLMAAVCYVTKEGCKLIAENIDRLKTEGSFIIIGYNDVSDIEEINKLCAMAPGKIFFHGVGRSSECWEGSLAPGLMHDKLIYAESESGSIAWVGSHNLTYNALRGVNIESATITTGLRSETFFNDVRAHLQSILQESFEGPAPTATRTWTEEPRRELLLIHCSADEEQIRAINEKKNCFISIHLKQEGYDTLCRPPANPEKHVRLHLYAPEDLLPDGPRAPAKLIKAGELYGVNFTEKNIRKGNKADWPEMSFTIVEPKPVGKKFQPLHVCSQPHDPALDVTVCAIRVDEALKELSEDDYGIILTDKPEDVIKNKYTKIQLSGIQGERRKRYISVIQSQQTTTLLKGRGVIAGHDRVRALYAQASKPLEIKQKDKGEFRFIHNGKLFMLSDGQSR